jgi:OmcA/MtrC family decaheme c-type cytochrome
MVMPVTLTTLTEGVDYTLNPATGQITEVVEFGAGNAVVISYTSDFIVPAVYGVPLNGSPDVGETLGKWTGKSLVSGTYTLGLWGSRNINAVIPPQAPTETTSYRAPTPGTSLNVLVGSATTMRPYEAIEGDESCNACHSDIYFHGNNRRGFDSCILCHGTAGAEDRPTWVSTNSAPTIGTKINFREMLHKIHHGEELANAATYEVVGFGGNSAFYDEVVFPAWPGGTIQCRKCHGEGSTAWQEPESREHPTEQMMPALAWRDVCSSCHDGSDAAAHFEVNTSASGAESCAVCHGPSGVFAVQLHHTPR